MVVTENDVPTKVTNSLSAFGPARATVKGEPLSLDELKKIDDYWQACCYLAAGMIYLQANPLLKNPLKIEHVKQRLLGHWGASPGLSFAYVHNLPGLFARVSTSSRDHEFQLSPYILATIRHHWIARHFSMGSTI